MAKIIVVDDDVTNVQLLQMLLELEGHEVTPCTNIEEATRAATSHTEAFVIDWHLERNMSGLDLLTAVRLGETNADKETVVIMTSGDHRREKAAMADGANMFLLKPYPPDVLSSVLEELLSKEGGSG